MGRHIFALAAASRQPTGAGFDLLLLAHIVTVLGGLAAVVVSGAQAGRLLACRGGEPPGNLRRYYEPGTNWVGRVLYAVPVLGFVLIADSGGAFTTSDDWVLMGLGIWVVAIMVGEGVLWPAERRVQELVAAEPVVPDGGAAGTERPDLGRRDQDCRKIVMAVSLMIVLLVAACVLMVARP